MDRSPPGSSVHGILQAKVLEWVGIAFSRGSPSQTQGLNPGLLHCRQTLYHLHHQGSPRCRLKSPSLLSAIGQAWFSAPGGTPALSGKVALSQPVSLLLLSQQGKVLSLQFAEMEASHRVGIPFLLSHPVDEKQVIVVLTLKGRRLQQGWTH